MVPGALPITAPVSTDRADSLRLTLQRPQSHYAQRFNRRYGRSGHLWQGRFFSCPLGRDHLVTALAYVDLNPVQAHLAGHDSTGLLDLELWREIPSAMHWADALQPPPTEQDTARLRQATMAGLPLGEAEFGEDREQAFSCRLIPGRPGRKPHNAAVSA